MFRELSTVDEDKGKDQGESQKVRTRLKKEPVIGESRAMTSETECIREYRRDVHSMVLSPIIHPSLFLIYRQHPCKQICIITNALLPKCQKSCAK